MTRCTVLEPNVSRSVELHVHNRPLRGRQHDLLNELLALVASAVSAHELHPSAVHGDVEDPCVGSVDEVDADDLSDGGLVAKLCLPIRKHDVPEPPHCGEGGTGSTEGGHLPVLDEYVVESDRQFPVDRRPIGRIGGTYNDCPGQAHLLSKVLPDMRVIPVDS